MTLLKRFSARAVPNDIVLPRTVSGYTVNMGEKFDKLLIVIVPGGPRIRTMEDLHTGQVDFKGDCRSVALWIVCLMESLSLSAMLGLLQDTYTGTVPPP